MTDRTEAAVPLTERFPGLRRLAMVGHKKVPFIPQHSDVECGVACLAMVLAYHGKHVAREQLRSVLGPTRDGVRAAHLLRTGRHFGLQARGVKAELPALRHVPRGAVLHWQFNHYVVLQGVGKAHLDIVDPGRGPRRVTWEEVDRCFTGVVLMFEPGSDFECGESRPKRQGLLGQMLKAGDWKRIFGVSFAAQLVTLALPMLVALIVDRVLPRSDARLLQVVSIGLALIAAFYWLTQVVRGHLLLHLRTVLDAKMSMELVDKLLALPYTFFQQRSVGDLVMRLESSKAVREILTSGALTAGLDGSMMLLYLALLLGISPMLGGVVLALGSINVLVLLLSRGRRRAFQADMIERQAVSESYQYEMLSAVETIKGMGCEHRAVERWCSNFVDLTNKQLAYGRLEILFQSLTSVLRLGAPLVIFTLGALEVLAGKMSIGTMLAVNTFAVGVFDPMSRLVEKLEDLERLKLYVDRMLDIHDSPREQPLGRAPLHETLSGEIELQNVSFRHGPLERDVVKELSLAIRPGEFIGVVGSSGAGKSTLASLILGLYQPTQGRVLYDERSLQDVDLGSLRAQIGVVTQDTQLFAGTIFDNIALSDPDMTAADVERAARLAQIHEDIIQMPAGYNTVLAGGGSSISGGQRQRIALARALARRPAILVLDEATSALDTESEAAIQAALEQVNCTRIVIAHRLSTVARADRIVVMQEGQIAELGAPADLLKRGQAYARLVGQQPGALAAAAPQPLQIPAQLAEPPLAATHLNGAEPQPKVAEALPASSPVMGAPTQGEPHPQLRPSPAAQPAAAVAAQRPPRSRQQTKVGRPQPSVQVQQPVRLAQTVVEHGTPMVQATVLSSRAYAVEDARASAGTPDLVITRREAQPRVQQEQPQAVAPAPGAAAPVVQVAGCQVVGSG